MGSLLLVLVLVLVLVLPVVCSYSRPSSLFSLVVIFDDILYVSFFQSSSALFLFLLPIFFLLHFPSA